MKSEKLWKVCDTCEKQISASAKSCPHCGARNKRSGVWKWVGGGLLALTVIGAMSSNDKHQKANVESANLSKTTIPGLSEALLPEPQKAFISIINDYRSRFAAATNEFQESAARDERRVAIMALIGQGMKVENWIGTLRELQTSSSGKGIVRVRIAPDIDILTWNNALADQMHGTMIEKETEAYGTLMRSAVGDKVRVSGNFIDADSDGILETSLTIKGAMEAPEFLFQFCNIQKY